MRRLIEWLERSDPTSRDIPIDKDHAALLLIDVQNYGAHPAGGAAARLTEEEKSERDGFFRQLTTTALPNLRAY